jgi:hypothetical protein
MTQRINLKETDPEERDPTGQDRIEKNRAEIEDFPANRLQIHGKEKNTN